MDLRHNAKCLVVVDKCECVDAYDYPKGYARLSDRYGCSSSTKRRQIVHSWKSRWTPVLYGWQSLFYIESTRILYKNTRFRVWTKILSYSIFRWYRVSQFAWTRDLIERGFFFLFLFIYFICVKCKFYEGCNILSKDMRTKVQRGATEERR